MSGMSLAGRLVDSLTVRPVGAGPSATPAADASGRPDTPARQSGCGEGRDMSRPPLGAGPRPRLRARAAALPALPAWRGRRQGGRTPVRRPQWARMTMRKACRGMLCAAGLLLMGTETAWAQAPTISVSFISINRYVVTFSEALTNSPATTDFTVDYDGTSVAVNAVHVTTTSSGSTQWRIDLAAYLAPEEIATIAYAKPASNPPQDSDGNHLASFTQMRKTTTSWSPVTIRDVFTDEDGDGISIEFSHSLEIVTPDKDRFSITVDGGAVDVEQVILQNSGEIAGRGRVFLVLGQQIHELQTVTVSYNRVTGDVNALRDGLSTSHLIQSFTRAVANKVGQPTPTIDLVRIVSAPTYDADSDGVRDTYVQGDKILADVEYSVPVSVTGTPRLRLQLGADGNTGAPVVANRKQVNFESKLHGGRTLRFAYTVAAADSDSDGVWIETSGSNKTVVFLPGAANVTLADTSTQAELTRTGLPTTGDALAKVDGTKTSSDRGPLPTGATVNGARLEVTFDKTLDTSVDTSDLPLYFSVYGTELSGGHRNAYQHPSTVAFATGDNMKIVLTLSEPARGGDTVKLNYTLINHTGLLKDSDDNTAPAFFDLAVTNNTAGTVGPAPSRASVRARTLQLVFDGDLDEASTPAGSAFLVETDDLDDDKRSIAGTGTATVSGATVTVDLDANEEAVDPDDLVLVSYTPPASNPLQNADGDDVLAFERFRVETVLDGIPPAFVGAEAMQTSASPATSKVVIYFDEPLDTSSVPVAGHFTLLMGPPSTSVTPSSVAVESDAVTLTLNQGIASTITTVSVGYAGANNSIRDLAGNAAAGFNHGITPTTAATPVLQTSGTDAPAVDGASLTLTYDLPLDPAKVPGADRYTLHYQLASGETDREEYAVDVAAVAVRHKKIVLQLSTPVFPCSPEPTVSYAQESGGTNVEGIDGTAAAAISHQVVTNKRKSGCTRAQGVRGNSGGQGKSVRLKFRRTLDTARALQASAFRLAGASAPSVAGAAYTADAAGVALTLNRALAPGETVEARYERPVDEPGLWNTAGEQIADFSGVTVTNEEPAAPSVSVSDARAAEGEAVEFTVSLSEASDEQVTVDYATSDGTAESGTDFTAGSGTLDLLGERHLGDGAGGDGGRLGGRGGRDLHADAVEPGGRHAGRRGGDRHHRGRRRGARSADGGVPRHADRAQRRPAVQLRDPVQRGVRGAAPDGARGRGARGDGRAPSGREAHDAGREP